MSTALRFVVHGRVQGVGFRWFVAREARALGLAGWVRNLPDGRVEAVAHGDSTALAKLEERLRAGPPSAWVQMVERREEPLDRSAVRSFEIR